MVGEQGFLSSATSKEHFIAKNAAKKKAPDGAFFFDAEKT
jgi:hypothetical protein